MPVKPDTLVHIQLNGLSGPSGKVHKAGDLRWTFSRVGIGDIEQWGRA